ncbi:MAG: GNAT family N-acetyltransferase [candidate division Zixibacteria bacterium]|nr:GNAT family N-acetyltransferase [candidate division Zixibacteria bacterium]
MIYSDTVKGISPGKLKGFFKGWKRQVTPEEHLRILRNSAEVVIAIDDETGNVVGFINAISDNVLSAFIPLLEVLPEYRKQGIATGLVKRLMYKFEGLYGIDLVCDKDLVDFYEKFGFRSHIAMIKRNFKT